MGSRQRLVDSGQWAVGSRDYGRRRITDYGLRIALLVLLVTLLIPTAAMAQSVTSDDVNSVAKGLYCPVCESEPLDTCQTQACQDWRDEIRVQLEAGATEAEIFDNFRARYGDRVLAEPPADGFNLLLWLGLPLGVVVGGVIFGRYLRTIRQTNSKPTAVASEGGDSAETTNDYAHRDDDYIRRIEEEIANNP